MGAHMGRAMEDRLLQGAARTGVNVLWRKRGLGLGGLADRLGEIATLRSTAVKDAGLVEVQMSLDETGATQPAVESDRLPPGFEPRCDRLDLSRRDPDIARPATVEARVLQDE